MITIVKLVVIFSLVSVQVSAQALDSQVYTRLKSLVVMTGHHEDDNLKAGIDAITNNPVPYLKALADDTSLRIYAKQKAISALKFYQSAESEAFLEGKVQDTALHPSLRNFAAKSYAEGFYRQNPAKAEAMLSRFESDPKIGATVRMSLQEARKRSPHEVPKKPDKDFGMKKKVP